MSDEMSQREREFREWVHDTNAGRCDDMPGKGCRCFALPIQAFTEWPAWQACRARCVERLRERADLASKAMVKSAAAGDRTRMTEQQGARIALREVADDLEST